MAEQDFDKRYILRQEFVMYCKSVNGDLGDLKLMVSKIDTTLEARHKETRQDMQVAQQNMERALATSNAVTEKALVTSNENMTKSLEGMMSKSYAIIITVITGLLMGTLGAFFALLVTRGR